MKNYNIFFKIIYVTPFLGTLYTYKNPDGHPAVLTWSDDIETDDDKSDASDDDNDQDHHDGDTRGGYNVVILSIVTRYYPGQLFQSHRVLGRFHSWTRPTGLRCHKERYIKY